MPTDPPNTPDQDDERPGEATEAQAAGTAAPGDRMAQALDDQGEAVGRGGRSGRGSRLHFTKTLDAGALTNQTIIAPCWQKGADHEECDSRR